ncbi:UNVERIFIED_CONTAM: hypothetical protein Sangu_1980400 [Sesamum angustifolium]|uniref:Secreted protein n=1 Tax=Sesamum angustifolium TaxID=2727405 RepID=A0AAW2LX74_9LAMI
MSNCSAVNSSTVPIVPKTLFAFFSFAQTFIGDSSTVPAPRPLPTILTQPAQTSLHPPAWICRQPTVSCTMIPTNAACYFMPHENGD